MSEVQRIVSQLGRSFEGESWHGPAVLEALADVSVDEAWFRAAPDVHSIAELVLHMATWKRAVAERVQGRRMDPSAAEDWPEAGTSGTELWERAKAGLLDAHATLVAAAAALADDGLDQAPAGGSHRYVQLHGAVQHDLYHAGQIVLLKKLARSGAAARG